MKSRDLALLHPADDLSQQVGKGESRVGEVFDRLIVGRGLRLLSQLVSVVNRAEPYGRGVGVHRCNIVSVDDLQVSHAAHGSGPCTTPEEGAAA